MTKPALAFNLSVRREKLTDVTASAAKVTSVVSDSVLPPQTAAHRAPLSLGFSRQEHWSGLPFPSPVPESEK